MRTLTRSLLLGIGLIAALNGNAEPATLTWADRVNHPERRPTETKVGVQLKFKSGVLPAGTAVHIETVTPTGAQLIAPQGFLFNIDRKDVAFVSWPTDATTPPYLEFARQNSVPWPSLPAERKSLFANLGVFEIPGILVVDRFGNRVPATNTQPGAPLEAADATLAKLDPGLKP